MPFADEKRSIVKENRVTTPNIEKYTISVYFDTLVYPFPLKYSLPLSCQFSSSPFQNTSLYPFYNRNLSDL